MGVTLSLLLTSQFSLQFLISGTSSQGNSNRDVQHIASGNNYFTILFLFTLFFINNKSLSLFIMP